MAAYEDETPYYQTKQNPQKPSNPVLATSSSGLFADAIKEGWVLKKGPQTLAGWKKRYLQLSANKQVGYYTDDSMVSKKGTIFLNKLTIHHIKRSSKTSDSKHHGFCVITDKRTYQFCVASSTDRDHWIQKIREVVDEKWDAHKIEKPSISYSSSQRENHDQITKQNNVLMNGGKVKHNVKHKKKRYGSYDDWDDDDDDDYGNGATLKIKNNMLNGDNNNYNNSNFNVKPKPKTNNTMYDDDEKEDRFAHRSKYKRRNEQNEVMLTEQEAQQQIQELEQKNDTILDDALMTTYQTQEIAADTAQQLDDQRHQLIGIDKNLHEIDQDLDKTEGILDGMKSWGGMIKRKFKKNKEPQREAYQAPITNKSTFERNQHRKVNNDNNNTSMPTEISQYEADNVQNEKLDELLKNMKAINQTAHDINTELDEQDTIIDAISDKMDKVAPRMQKQTHTMKKICD